MENKFVDINYIGLVVQNQVGIILELMIFMIQRKMNQYGIQQNYQMEEEHGQCLPIIHMKLNIVIQNVDGPINSDIANGYTKNHQKRGVTINGNIHIIETNPLNILSLIFFVVFASLNKTSRNTPCVKSGKKNIIVSPSKLYEPKIKPRIGDFRR